MAWLQRGVRRCVAWVRSLWRRPTLVVTDVAPCAEPRLVVATPAGARVETTLVIRQETPPGLARLAALLAACGDDTVFRTEGGLAGPAAPSG